MFFLVTDSYDKFTEFLLRHPFLTGQVGYNPNISVLLTEPSVLILIEGSRATDCYHNIISLNRRNPRIAFIDYADKPTWEPEASIILNDFQYTKMYNAYKRRHITYSARIMEDYRIKVSFPESETAFILQFTI